jgi:hypothetical protein
MYKAKNSMKLNCQVIYTDHTRKDDSNQNSVLYAE